jgi:CheY-like chemotaxis protein
MRILYVEDNDDNVYMLKMRFELLDGFAIIVAEDGEAGCVKARTEHPDIILMGSRPPELGRGHATTRVH